MMLLSRDRPAIPTWNVLPGSLFLWCRQWHRLTANGFLFTCLTLPEPCGSSQLSKTHGSSRYVQKLDHILSRMSFTSNPFTVGSRSRTDASAWPETTTAPHGSTSPRYPDVLLRLANGVRLSWRNYDVRFFPLNLPLAAVVDRLVHPASHRYRRGVLPGAQRRRARSDLSGGSCHAQPPEDSRD